MGDIILQKDSESATTNNQMKTFFIIPIYGRCSKPLEISDKIRNILPKEDIEIIFVDDSRSNRISKDNKFHRFSGYVHFINSGGVGQHRAIFYGIRYVIEEFGRLFEQKGYNSENKLENSAFIVMDGDLSHDPSYIPIFLEKLKNSGLVLGLSEKEYAFPRNIFTSLFYYFLYIFLILWKKRIERIDIIPTFIFKPQILRRLTTFIAFKPNLIDNLNLKSNRKNLLVYLIFSAIKNKEKIDFIMVKKNFDGCSSYTFPKLFRLSLETLSEILLSLWKIGKEKTIFRL
jgi:hypothetical protein